MNKAQYDALRTVTNRRLYASENIHYCPFCGSNQIQLVDWTQPEVASYRCRMNLGHCFMASIPPDNKLTEESK